MEKEYNLPESPKKDVFKVPDGYFENFNERLFYVLDTESIQKRVSRIRRLSTWTSIAASLLLVVGITLFFNSKNQYDALNTETLENYLQTQSAFISTNMEAYLEEQDLLEMEQNSSLDKNELGEYLLTSTDIEYYINE